MIPNGPLNETLTQVFSNECIFYSLNFNLMCSNYIGKSQFIFTYYMIKVYKIQ